MPSHARYDCMSSKFGVGSSSRFPFKSVDTQTHKVTDAADHIQCMKMFCRLRALLAQLLCNQ